MILDSSSSQKDLSFKCQLAYMFPERQMIHVTSFPWFNLRALYLKAKHTKDISWLSLQFYTQRVNPSRKGSSNPYQLNSFSTTVMKAFVSGFCIAWQVMRQLPLQKLQHDLPSNAKTTDFRFGMLVLE